MAYAFPSKVMFSKWETMLNPCRWCGEPALLERNQSDWAYEDQLRATCREVHEPVYLGGSVYRDGDTSNYYRRLFAAVRHLADLWNERNDGPGFMAGLA